MDCNLYCNLLLVELWRFQSTTLFAKKHVCYFDLLCSMRIFLYLQNYLVPQRLVDLYLFIVLICLLEECI